VAIYRDREVFEQVRVNPGGRTIEWPGGVDLDPDVLYGAFEPEGIRIERRLVEEPAGHRSLTGSAPLALRCAQTRVTRVGIGAPNREDFA
jgi:Protein of unknown function (DUF2442)